MRRATIPGATIAGVIVLALLLLAPAPAAAAATLPAPTLPAPALPAPTHPVATLPGASAHAPTPLGPVAAAFPIPPILPPPLPLSVPGAGSVVGGLANDAAGTVLDAVAGWVSSGAASLLSSLATAIDGKTSPVDTQPWLDGHFRIMALIAADLATPLLVAVAITAIVRRDLGLLLRAAFVQAPLALLGTWAAMTIVGLALEATNELCNEVASTTHIDAAGLLRNLIVALSRGGSNVTGFGLVLVSMLIATGGFFLTIELVVREAAIWVAMLFLPLGLVALVWPATARWGRRLAELLVVLVLSKFVIVAIVSMAVSATSAGLSRPDIGPLFGGAALLLLAAAAPFTLLRMVPVVEAGVVAHLEGVGRRALSPPAMVQQAVQQTAQSQISRMLEERAAAGGAPTQPPAAVGLQPAPVAAPTRARDADGTQSGPDKPVPAAPEWRHGVRVVPGPGAPAASPGVPGAGAAGAATGGAILA